MLTEQEHQRAGEIQVFRPIAGASSLAPLTKSHIVRVYAPSQDFPLTTQAPGAEEKRYLSGTGFRVDTVERYVTLIYEVAGMARNALNEPTAAGCLFGFPFSKVVRIGTPEEYAALAEDMKGSVSAKGEATLISWERYRERYGDSGK